MTLRLPKTFSVYQRVESMIHPNQHRTAFNILWLCLLVLTLVLTSPGCTPAPSDFVKKNQVLRLATTTSARDSGLLDVLLPEFERENDCRIDVIAVGTGAALQLGSSGDADAVLVHARHAEQRFMSAGYGSRREEFMKNEFVILGPADDPANVKGRSARQILSMLSSKNQRFLSRGDESGTHQKERELWAGLNIEPAWENFMESGQGMGATLTMADEMRAYVLCDMGTYLNFRDRIELAPLNSPSAGLDNHYSCIVVNPDRHSHLTTNLANSFADYLISRSVQQKIARYQLHGFSLFTPTRLAETP